MRALSIEDFQNKTTTDGWGGTVDNGKFLTSPVYQMFEAGRFQKIPMIIGSMYSNSRSMDKK